jgi:hypothetical protein
MAIRIHPKPLSHNHFDFSNRKWKRVFHQIPVKPLPTALLSSARRPSRARPKFYPIHVSTSFLPNSLKTQLPNFSTRNTTRSFRAVADLGVPISAPHATSGAPDKPAFGLLAWSSHRSRVTVFLATRHSPPATAFLIVNMIIRIAPKPLVFSANSISNRQYPRAAAELSLSFSPTSYRIPPARGVHV